MGALRVKRRGELGGRKGRRRSILRVGIRGRMLDEEIWRRGRGSWGRNGVEAGVDAI